MEEAPDAAKQFATFESARHFNGMIASQVECCACRAFVGVTCEDLLEQDSSAPKVVAECASCHRTARPCGAGQRPKIISITPEMVTLWGLYVLNLIV